MHSLIEQTGCRLTPLPAAIHLDRTAPERAFFQEIMLGWTWNDENRERRTTRTFKEKQHVPPEQTMLSQCVVGTLGRAAKMARDDWTKFNVCAFEIRES